MKAALSQPVTDYAAREAAAPAAIKEQLAVLRRQLAEQKASFDVGYTTALDVPLSMLAGTKIPDLPSSVIEAVNARAMQLARIDEQSAAAAKIALPPAPCVANNASFDWRKSGKINPIRTQICGTCWDFAAMGAYEGSYAIRNNQLVDTSEQYVLNCAQAGSCNGGWWMPVFNYLISHGTASEKDDKFTGNDALPCPAGIPSPYRAANWGFVANSQWTIPSVAAIKAALCAHGPLTTAVQADAAFQGYTGGPSGDQVFDESSIKFGPQQVNHGIVIIGWDDAKKAWLIRNSWGPGWGSTAGYGTEKGYMWIAYTTNNVGIATAWVDALSVKYVLNPQWETLLKSLKVDVAPLPKL
jgi:cathepsin L